MKKVVSIALALTLLLSMALFTACTGGNEEEMTTTSEFTDIDGTSAEDFTNESESESEPEADETSSSNPGNVELTTTEEDSSTTTSKAQ